MAIDVGRSIRIARARTGMSNRDIAERLGLHVVYVSKRANSPGATSEIIERFAALFDMTPSDFIALGETDDIQQ